ncbi:MAG: hypothetical protein KGN79_02975 [Acidobacteriota bacterium]|nr:hypothetical protein [Acidobacteriota bacterium]
MKRYPQFEVAISDADRAEIEAIYIELMRERDLAAESGSDTTGTSSSDLPGDSEAH